MVSNQGLKTLTMKTATRYLSFPKRFHSPFLWILFLIITFAPTLNANAQGKVIINEYLSWASNGCATETEYIELMNFGPGAVDISCYILTDGDYAITIPANTILQAGQLYIISGVDTIPPGCANINNLPVVVQLNWNKGNCTSAPIPKTGDGFMTDGGEGSEQLVLFTPELDIVDAIVRKIPEPSSTITTAANGSCGAVTFDLDNMSIPYEIIGESQGRGNSFARLTNGGCTWLKDPQQSAGTNNNTPAAPNYSSSLSVTEAVSCTNNGSVVVNITATDLTAVFPMSYILARDVDSNGVFNNKDEYTVGTDYDAPTLSFPNLAPGVYKLVTENANGCDLQMTQFNILDCNAITLPSYFTWVDAKFQQSETLLRWNLNASTQPDYFIIETSTDGKYFYSIDTLQLEAGSLNKSFKLIIPTIQNRFFRIKMITLQQQVVYSDVVRNYADAPNDYNLSLSPNPANNKVNVKFITETKGINYFDICDMNGQVLRRFPVQLEAGLNIIPLEINFLAKGIYLIRTETIGNQHGFVQRMVKY